jgi:hypothetical protein
MLVEAVEDLNHGIEIGEITAYAGAAGRGRYAEEVNLVVHLRKGGRTAPLLYTKVYYGRKPYYLPWCEMGGIRAELDLGEPFAYFDSAVEEGLLGLFARHLGAGGKIHVEYEADRETAYALEYGAPPPATRLGSKLFALGFTWFKDWYFPEGWSEGGMKLQGEKPPDEKGRRRQLLAIRSEIAAFREKSSVEPGEGRVEDGKWLAAAKERADMLFVQIESDLEKTLAQEGPPEAR